MLYWKLSKYIICCVDETYCRFTIDYLTTQRDDSLQISSCFTTKVNFVCRASSFLSTTKTFASSAYRISFTPWKLNDRSLMYIENKRDLVVHHVHRQSHRLSSMSKRMRIVLGSTGRGAVSLASIDGSTSSNFAMD